jgi:hypothetical protein
MPERNRQLLEDMPSSSRSDKGKQRKAEPINTTSILPQKRKRKAVEKEIVEIIPKVLPSKVCSVLLQLVSGLTFLNSRKRLSTPRHKI